MNSTQNTADTGPTTLWNRGFLMILVFGFMTGTAGQMVGPLLSKYTISLGASLALAGSLVGLINVVAAIIRPIGGAAADRLNRKHVMIFALVLYALAYTGFLLFPAIPAIVICRILQGAGASLLGIARIAFSTEFIPKDRMGEGITLNSFGIVISQALGPGIGLAISDRWGFQACFLIAVICNALGIIIISTLPYKPTKIAEKRRLQLRSLIEPKIIPYGILSGMLSILTSMATTFVPLIGDERGIPNVALFFTTYAILALILRPVTGRLLDRYGLAPSAVAKELPFYCGAFMTNNASIGLHHVWHHIYNFGNVSLFMGMGSVLKEATVEPDGRVRMKRWLPIGITADERVCSGAHYAAFFADVRKYFDHPELLEVPPETVRFDPGVEYHVPKVKKPEPSEK